MNLLLWCFGPPIALLLLTGACDAPGGSLSPAEQAGTAKLREDWNVRSSQEKRSNMPRKGGFYPEQVRILKDLLGAAPAAVVEAEFQRIWASDVPKSYDHSADVDKNYDYVLLIGLVERTVERKDAQRLTKLLSHHCPRELVYCPLEFYLAYNWHGSINRLFDCYAAAQTSSTKEDIAYCLGRAFPLLRKRFAVDSEFVKEARAWYVANKADLKLNEHYMYIPSLPPPLNAGEDRTNLFHYSPK